MADRIAKINELIRHTLSEILTRELNLKPGVFLTVVKVDTTRDLRYTRVFFSVYPEADINYVSQSLKKDINVLQQKLNQRLSMKPLPRIEFHSDLTEARADDVEKIIEKIKKEKKSRE